MPKTVMDYYLWDIERLPLKDKETLFWKFYDILRDEPCLVTTFSKEEVNERFFTNFNDEDYDYLKQNPLTYYEMINDCVNAVLSDQIFDRDRGKEK